jgi:hypothetical protein
MMMRTNAQHVREYEESSAEPSESSSAEPSESNFKQHMASVHSIDEHSVSTRISYKKVVLGSRF